MTKPVSPAGRPKQNRRAFWLRQLHQWHWISAAVSLIAMLVFVVTGVTLNHAGQIEAKPSVVTKQARLPETLVAALKERSDKSNTALPPAVSLWVREHLGISVHGRQAEWSDGEVYIALPRPGGDAWLSVDLDAGDVKYERTDRGWIAYFNDLHKGRHTGLAWSLFIDVFAVACLIFCVTGLFLMKMHARTRPMTWPVVGLGLIIPLFLILLFIH